MARSHSDEYHTFVQSVAAQVAAFASIERASAALNKSLTLEQAEKRLDVVEKKWAEISERDSTMFCFKEISECLEDDYFAEQFMASGEDMYIDTVARLAAVIKNHGGPTASTSSPTAVPAHVEHRRTQVPAIKLPQFSGMISDWIEFREHFHALILANDSFTDFERLYYLKSCLEGEAANLMKNVSLTADNFQLAWKLLTDRYENKRRLLHIQLTKLFSLKSVTREGSPAEIRSLLDSVNEIVDSLQKLDRHVSDDILVYIVGQRLDPSTREAWDFSLESDEFATFDQLSIFLNNKIRALDASHNFAKVTRTLGSQSRIKSTASHVQTHHLTQHAVSSCKLCNESHLLFKYAKFIEKFVPQRWDFMKRIRACSNCLSPFHRVDACKSERNCSHCKKRHHSLLHSQSKRADTLPPSTNSAEENFQTPQVDTNLVQTFLSTPQVPAHVVLATAWVLVTSASNRTVKLRALLDLGSTHTFVSREVANALRTKLYSTSVVASGLGQQQSAKVDKIIPISISSVRSKEVSLSTDALVIDKITDYVPKFRFLLSQWSHLENLELADGCPTDDTPIHMLIGSDVYPYALRDGMRRGKRDEPVAVSTIFGWVLSGNSDTPRNPLDSTQVHAHHAITRCVELQKTLVRFWEIEEIPVPRFCSEEDERCERHFVETHSRSATGRYVVRIPLKDFPPLDIGNTYARAKQCLLATERRMASHPQQGKAYLDFMNDYESLGHMRIANAPSSSTRVMYLSHHPVVKDSSTTTKTRIVFNASAPSTSGKSLNDMQLTGPKLQSDLQLLHLQWRVYKYVYAADIAKMYRQILVEERDIDLQRILWRTSQTEPMLEYQLLTVTYGTASAPFLAQRVLRQLAEDEGHSLPLGKLILLSSMFVDDALFGADSVEQAQRMRDELNALLGKGHFQLRKWSSNSTILLADIDPKDHGLSCDKLLQLDESVQILGIAWRPSEDTYRIHVNPSDSVIITKRMILSEVARIFDPLGWIAPIVVVAKHIMQRLWLCEGGWDSTLPTELEEAWLSFRSSLIFLKEISIPRWLGTHASLPYELHGFSDASEKAYAAVIYVRTRTPSGDISTTLLTAKARVAPLKQLSIPRLELCGALLLARLLAHVRTLPSFAQCPVHAWTDATIVLTWLRGHPTQWKTFIANRVSEVQTLLPNASWRHVPGCDNPADIASRGIHGAELKDCRLWWTGPSWLPKSAKNWPSVEPILGSDAPLEQKSLAHAVTAIPDSFLEIASRFSSWPFMCRVLLRILQLSKHWKDAAMTKNGDVAYTHELGRVKMRVFSLVQSSAFSRELSVLQNCSIDSYAWHRLDPQHALHRGSPLRRLNPVLDENGLLRVGGRLSMAQLPLNAKYPIILPNGHVALLLTRQAHLCCLHGGITLTLSTLRNTVWLLQARRLVKSVTSHCVVCARHVAEVPTQLMGSLPPARVVRPLRAFSESGVDYAGPIKLRLAGGRGSRSQLAYVAIFVCMASRAVHLEVVSALSTPAFIAAFQRFCSRRGLPRTMYSDCGTNFVGADKELRTAYRAAVNSDLFHARTAKEGVNWKFIPPAAPHFGGLWEAGVRSMKRHLSRVLGQHTPTYEEITTLLCRIEACMNSRPLAPLTDDIEDLQVLTPAHFLIGGSLLSNATLLAVDYSVGRIARWKLFQQMLENFWRSWSKDYVTLCQHRSKWSHTSNSLRVGQIVLMRDNNLPPASWRLARIVQCHPGSDGLVRVVTVRTDTKEYKRPIVKLALLPVDIEGDAAPSSMGSRDVGTT